MPLVTVIGAGVSGLTSAYALERAGYRVRVLAMEDGRRSVSAVAAALWHPLLVEASERTARWAATTREELLRIAATDAGAGVDVLTLFEIGDEEVAPWWSSAVGGLTRCDGAFPGSGSAKYGWTVSVPRVVPRMMLRWLESKLRAAVEYGCVGTLDAVGGEVVVNCAGLGAGRLAGDAELSGLLGQVVVTQPGTIDMSVAVTQTKADGSVLYVVPRRNEVVLGGLARPWRVGEPTPVPDERVTADIIERAREAGFGVGPVMRALAGVRPWRPRVRVEREGRIVHNYGHGGSGWTLGFGCAAEVVRLVGAIT